MAVRTSLIVVLSAAMTACATPESGVFRGGAAMRGVPDRLADPTETRVIACREVSAAHYIVSDPVAARPGDAVNLNHFAGGLYARRTLPFYCVSQWSIDPAASAQLSGDRRALLVSPDVAPGSEITLSVTANGHVHVLRVPILSPDQLDIYGNWSAVSRSACDGSLPPAEVRFNVDGTVWFYLGLSGNRWGPIWPFSVDFDTGSLTILDQTGRARLNDKGQLVVTGTRFPTSLPGVQSPPEGGGCRTWTGLADMPAGVRQNLIIHLLASFETAAARIDLWTLSGRAFFDL